MAHYKLSHPLLHIGNKKEASKRPDDKFFIWFLNELQELSDRGIRIVMLPPALAQTAYDNQKDNIHIIDSMLRESDFPFICPPSAMSYPDSLYYDSYYHLDSLGAAIHSKDLIFLLREHNIIPCDSTCARTRANFCFSRRVPCFWERSGECTLSPKSKFVIYPSTFFSFICQ